MPAPAICGPSPRGIGLCVWLVGRYAVSSARRSACGPDLRSLGVAKGRGGGSYVPRDIITLSRLSTSSSISWNWVVSHGGKTTRVLNARQERERDHTRRQRVRCTNTEPFSTSIPVGDAPEAAYVCFGPGRVDHNGMGSGAHETIEPSKDAIVGQLVHRCHSPDHVRGHRRIMHVAPDLAPSKQARQPIAKGIAHRV
jgi:hypothetical protein